jgi:hypothetical protein
MNSRRGLWIALALAGCFLLFGLAQLIRPSLGNSAPTAELQTPPEVRAILQNSCYSCHSTQTELPIYDRVVPAYWLVVKDVRDGRAHLNFSEMAKLPKAMQKAALFEAINQIQLGAMPLPRYLKVHPYAAVTPSQLRVLRQYAASLTVPAVMAVVAAPVPVAPTPAPVQLSPNGIAFLDDYKNWRPISSTDRWDNGTMRQILGNDVAQKALAEGHINPWPTGTTFAKVAWKAAPDGNGGIRAGDFAQVEFMIRDSKKYKSTAGWGWARWRGTDLKPYGKDAKLADECVSCHLPVRDADFVYTMPIQGAR